MRGTISLRTFETLSGQSQAQNLAAGQQHAEVLKLSSGKPQRANSALAVKCKIRNSPDLVEDSYCHTPRHNGFMTKSAESTCPGYPGQPLNLNNPPSELGNLVPVGTI
jgi:hypothetical protein